MDGYFVERDLCTRCGACVLSCGRQALANDGEGGPLLQDGTLCNACGHCSAACPVDAVVPPKCGGERAMPLPGGPDLDFACATRFLLSCRSIRRFKETLVPHGEILEILDIARKAPSGSNAQPVSWLILHGKAKAAQFTALTMEWFDTVIRNDPARKSLYRVENLVTRYKEKGDDPVLRGAPCAVIAVTSRGAPWGALDASVALTYFILAAHGRKIGCCWSGYGIRALEDFLPLREFVGLEESQVAQAMAFFGYPMIVYRDAVPPRKPLKARWI